MLNTVTFDRSKTPNNLEMESIFIGGAIYGAMDGKYDLADLTARMPADVLWHPIHRAIWQGVHDLAANRVPLTVEGLAAIIGTAETHHGDKVRDVLAECLDTGRGEKVLQFVQPLKDLYLRRELIEAGIRAIEDATAEAPDRTGIDRIETLETDLTALAQKGTARKPAKTMRDVMRETRNLNARRRAAVNGVGGVPTGLTDLDKRLGGMYGSELYILAARPSMGKTACATTIAANASRAGFHVKIVSLEMSTAQLGQRLIAAETGISVQEQGDAEIERDPKRCLAIEEAMQRIEALTLYVDDDDTQTITRIRAEARRDKRRGKLDLLIIDYLGLITSTDQSMNKVHAIEAITTGLKRLSKELDIPILLLCQLNRGVEGRDDKRPGLADLRDSGGIEQDADVVIMIFREEYYLSRSEPAETKAYAAWSDRMREVKGTAELLTVKFRQGEIGSDRVRFDGPRQRFSDL